VAILPVQENPVKPQEFHPSEMVQHVAEAYQSFVLLSPCQKVYVLALMDDFVADKFRTDTEIARDYGIAVKSVYNAKRNSNVMQAIRDIMPDIATTKLPEVIANAAMLSKKTYKAAEFVARFVGAYVPKSQQLNINANLRSRAQNVSPEQAIDTFLEKLLSLGWSPDRIYERAKELQANQT
jgi:hypothetical protein